MGLVVALALVAGVFGVQARQAQGRAEALQGKADQLIGYMLGELVDKLRPLGKLDLLDGVSARALTYLTGTLARETASLVQRAKALTLLAEVKTARGEVADAQTVLLAANDLLAKQVQQARAAAQDPALLKAAGENAFWLGNHYLTKKDWGNAERYFLQYRDWSDRYAALDPANVDAWNEQSYAHNNLGTLAIKQRKLAQAAEEFDAAIKLKTKVLARAPEKAEVTAERLVRSEIIDLLLDEAAFARERGERAAAHATCQEVVQILTPLMVNLADYRLRQPWKQANACVKGTAQ